MAAVFVSGSTGVAFAGDNDQTATDQTTTDQTTTVSSNVGATVNGNKIVQKGTTTASGALGLLPKSGDWKDKDKNHGWDKDKNHGWDKDKNHGWDKDCGCKKDEDEHKAEHEKDCPKHEDAKKSDAKKSDAKKSDDTGSDDTGSDDVGSDDTGSDEVPSTDIDDTEPDDTDVETVAAETSDVEDTSVVPEGAPDTGDGSSMLSFGPAPTQVASSNSLGDDVALGGGVAAALLVGAYGVQLSRHRRVGAHRG